MNVETQIATNMGQSKRLLEIGVPEDTADMYLHKECIAYWHNMTTDEGHEFNVFTPFKCGGTYKRPRNIFPAWSIEGLFTLLTNPTLKCTPNGWLCTTDAAEIDAQITMQGKTPFEAICATIEKVIEYGCTLKEMSNEQILLD